MNPNHRHYYQYCHSSNNSNNNSGIGHQRTTMFSPNFNEFDHSPTTTTTEPTNEEALYYHQQQQPVQQQQTLQHSPPHQLPPLPLSLTSPSSTKLLSRNSPPSSDSSPKSSRINQYNSSIGVKGPHQVARRNERERKRVQQVNNGFVRLRDHVPFNFKNRKLSKVETLRQASKYIEYLRSILTTPKTSSLSKANSSPTAAAAYDDDEDQSQSQSHPISPSPNPQVSFYSPTTYSDSPNADHSNDNNSDNCWTDHGKSIQYQHQQQYSTTNIGDYYYCHSNSSNYEHQNPHTNEDDIRVNRSDAFLYINHHHSSSSSSSTPYSSPNYNYNNQLSSPPYSS